MVHTLESWVRPEVNRICWALLPKTDPTRWSFAAAWESFVRSKIGSLLCQYGPFDSAVVVRIVVPVDDENPSVVELH